MKYLVFSNLLLTAILTLPISASTVTSLSCSTPASTLSSGSTSCSALGLYGYANTTSDTTVTLPASANQPAQIDTFSSGSALLAGIRGIANVSTAQVATNTSITFNTLGPVQNGYLELSFDQTAWNLPSYGQVGETMTIGSYTFNPSGQNIAPVFLPILLGTDFSFTFQDSLIVNGDAATGADSGSVGADISLQAFEADQSTPVQLFDPPSPNVSTPEPKSLGLFVVGALVALILIHKFRSAA